MPSEVSKAEKSLGFILASVRLSADALRLIETEGILSTKERLELEHAIRLLLRVKANLIQAAA